MRRMQLSSRRPVHVFPLSSRPPARRVAAGVLALVCIAGATSVRAGSVMEGLDTAWTRVTDLDAWRAPGHWRTVASPLTLHWRFSAEHRHVYALGMERQSDDRWLLGGSLFRNSFGQPSAYVYLGHRSDKLLGKPELFFQWSAGMLYGYKGKYKSKVPLNLNGFAPGAVLSLGWQFDRHVSVAAHALGDAGVMFQLGYDWR
jgi:hypothetical protein